MPPLERYPSQEQKRLQKRLIETSYPKPKLISCQQQPEELPILFIATPKGYLDKLALICRLPKPVKPTKEWNQCDSGPSWKQNQEERFGRHPRQSRASSSFPHKLYPICPRAEATAHSREHQQMYGPTFFSTVALYELAILLVRKASYSSSTAQAWGSDLEHRLGWFLAKHTSISAKGTLIFKRLPRKYKIHSLQCKNKW